MSTEGAKQPVVVVAESLMRTCYDEANRLANHGSNGLERMVMDHLYEAANEANARLAAAADDSEQPRQQEAPRSTPAHGSAHYVDVAVMARGQLPDVVKYLREAADAIEDGARSGSSGAAWLAVNGHFIAT